MKVTRSQVQAVELARAVCDGVLEVPMAGATDVVMQRIMVPPGESIDWHYHLGPMIVVVQSGTLTTLIAGRGTRTSTAGEAFIEPAGGHWVHKGVNAGAEPLIMFTTHLIPVSCPLSIAVDIDEDDLV